MNKIGQRAISVEVALLLALWAGSGGLTVWAMLVARTMGTMLLILVTYLIAVAMVWSFACLIANHRRRVLAASDAQTVAAVAEIREATVETVALMMAARVPDNVAHLTRRE